MSFYSVHIGVGQGCQGVGGNVSIWIFATGRGLQLPLSFLTMFIASLVFVRMAFQDSTTKEDFLTLLHLKERARSEDIYNAFKFVLSENEIPIHKLVAITTDAWCALWFCNTVP